MTIIHNEDFTYDRLLGSLCRMLCIVLVPNYDVWTILYTEALASLYYNGVFSKSISFYRLPTRLQSAMLYDVVLLFHLS